MKTIDLRGECYVMRVGLILTFTATRNRRFTDEPDSVGGCHWCYHSGADGSSTGADDIDDFYTLTRDAPPTLALLNISRVKLIAQNERWLTWPIADADGSGRR